MLLLLLAACAQNPCPTDRALQSDDLPCDCGVQPIEALTCGYLYCTEDGVIQGGDCA